MSQFEGPPGLPYATAIAPPARRSRGSLFGWVFFIGLAVMIFLLLSRRSSAPRGQQIDLSAFQQLLEKGQIASVVVERNELYGGFTDEPAAQMTGSVAAAGQFRVTLPEGMGEDWNFVNWLLSNRTGATVSARNNASSPVANILLPVIPWLLIFGFIWFFVFRQLRKVRAAEQSVIVANGPGRWVPDAPAPTPPQ